MECEGFEVSLLQHEIDHLDGLLTLDRAEPGERSRSRLGARGSPRLGGAQMDQQHRERWNSISAAV